MVNVQSGPKSEYT